MILPGFWFRLGFAMFVLILWRATRRRSLPPAPRPRRLEGPQVVGFPCAVCSERIVFDKEAAPCECGKPVHLTCMPHGHDDGKTPYRD